MSSLLHILFCIICIIYSNESARILAIYPMPSISHQVVFRPLMQELAKRGHEVVVITPDPVFSKDQSLKNLTEIDVHDVSYNIWNNFLESGKAQTQLTPATMKLFYDVIFEVFEAQIKSKDVQKLIHNKNNKFDLLFIEACVRPALSYGYLYRVPIIEYSSFGGILGTFEGTGAPTNSLVYPLPFHLRINNLNLWEKITVLYNDYLLDNMFTDLEEKENQLLKSIFSSQVLDITELKKNVQLSFLNVHPIWDLNRPVPPNIIYLGGIHQKPHKDLPKDLESYLNSSKNGVIYISFGTNARPSLLPAEKLRIFTNVFSQMQYDILWKWDTEELPGRSENIKISKWLPQSDLLKHPKIKLFITQGGLQSTDEAFTAGVPLVVIPFLGDQWFNAEQYVKLNIGVQLDLETITQAKLKNAIQTTIENNTYRQNVVKLHALMRDQPQSPLERAVWWTEHVLRHGGGTHLRAAGAHMHWAEYYALDVIVLLVTAFVTLFIGVIFVIRFIIFILLGSDIRIKVKKNN